MNFSFFLDQKNVADHDHHAIENVVHVLVHMIVIDEKRIHVNGHVLVQKDIVIIVVKVEKIKNLDDK